MPQAVPMITMYRPVKEGDRWLARADIVARGELIELQATASDQLAQRARGWFNQAAQWVSQWISYADGPPERLGVGVFGDLPVVATEVAQALTALPGREPVMQTAQDLYSAASADDQFAIQRIADIENRAVAGDTSALELHNAICLMREAMADPMSPWGLAGFSIGPIIAGAAAGDPAALQRFSALRNMSPAMPARIQYSVDEYCSCGDGCEHMAGDVIGASLYEMLSPRRRIVHRVAPGRYRPAIEAFRAINNGAIPPSIQPR